MVILKTGILITATTLFGGAVSSSDPINVEGFRRAQDSYLLHGDPAPQPAAPSVPFWETRRDKELADLLDQLDSTRCVIEIPAGQWLTNQRFRCPVQLRLHSGSIVSNCVFVRTVRVSLCPDCSGSAPGALLTRCNFTTEPTEGWTE